MRPPKTQIGQVGRDIRLPTHLPQRHPPIGSIIAVQALGNVVERNIEVAVQRDFAAAWGEKRQGIARLLLNKWTSRAFFLRLSLLLFLQLPGDRFELRFYSVQLPL